MKKYFVLVILFILFSKQAFVIGQEYIYKQFTTADGLPSSEVYHVLQDSNGYIWFATDNGVSRYNGYEFENFDTNDGLAENSISDIYEDQKGVIWFLGMTGKLTYFLDGRIHQFKYNDTIAHITPKETIVLKSGLYVDSVQNVYISLKSSDLFKISPNGEIKSYAETSISRNALSIYHFENNKLVLAIKSSKQHLDTIPFNLLFDKTNNSEIIINLPNNDLEYPHHAFVHFINDSSMWFSSGRSVYYIENSTVKFKRQFENKIVWMNSKSIGELWICTLKNGVESYQITDGTLVKKLHLLRGHTVSSVLKSNDGSYWLTTLNNGVYKLAPDKLLVINKQSGLLDNNVNCVELFNDTIWIGYDLNKISKISNNIIKHVTYSSFDANGVSKIHYDKDKKRLLIATIGDLYIIENEQIKAINKNYLNYFPESPYYFNATDVVGDKNEGYWISGSHGFFYIKYNHVVFDSERDKNFIIRVNSLKIIKDGLLWLGCHDGLRSFKNKKLHYYGNEFVKLKSEILDILIHKDLLILATKGNGILLFNGESVEQITKKDGLTSNLITSLAIKDSILWAGSLNGMNRINIGSSKFKHRVITVQTPSELSGFEINQVKIHQSKIYLATNKGLVINNILNSHISNNNLPFNFTKYTVNGQNVDLKNNYRLKRNQNNVGISFEALDYNTNLHLRYKYRLLGLDTNWVNTTQRFASYYYLKPGKYKFIAQVKNQNGKWEKPPISLSFEIAPAIWQTIPFRIGFILLFITLFLLVYSIKVANTKRKILIKRKIDGYKLQTLLGQMRPHFIFNTLNSINNYILTNESRSASKYLSKFSQLIRKILEYSQYEQIRLSEELEALELYLKIEAMRLRHKFDYSIDIDKDINTLETMVPSLILQPFVENSIWHGIQPLDKKGVIKIKISKKESTLAVDIIDNGIGREKAIKLSNRNYPEKKSLGTKITKERLELLSQKLNSEALVEYIDLYAKKESIGTRVKINLPLILERKRSLLN